MRRRMLDGSVRVAERNNTCVALILFSVPDVEVCIGCLVFEESVILVSFGNNYICELASPRGFLQRESSGFMTFLLKEEEKCTLRLRWSIQGI